MISNIIVGVLLVLGLWGRSDEPYQDYEPDPGTCFIEVRGRIIEYPCPPSGCYFFNPDTGEFEWIACPF